MVDVTSKRCEEETCPKRALCGYPGGKPMYCAEHRFEGMIRLNGTGERRKTQNGAEEEA
jgi:hypothetical protein